jgi:hypothetical protein
MKNFHRAETNIHSVKTHIHSGGKIHRKETISSKKKGTYQVETNPFVQTMQISI